MILYFKNKNSVFGRDGHKINFLVQNFLFKGLVTLWKIIKWI